MDQFFSRADVDAARARRRATGTRPTRTTSTPGRRRCWPRPSGRCWCSARTCGPTAPSTRRSRLAETAGVPVITNGMGRGVLPAGHPLLVTRARGEAFGQADLVVVVGTPLDFRLGYGTFGGKDGAPPAAVVHLADAPGQLAAPRRPRRRRPPATCRWSWTALLDGLAERREPARRTTAWTDAACRTPHGPRVEKDRALLDSDADPIHPARIYGELRPPAGRRRGRHRRRRRLRVVRRQVRRAEARPAAGWTPGRTAASAPAWATRSRPGWPARRSQVVLLLGDGAAGFSLMDVDTLVRHRCRS